MTQPRHAWHNPLGKPPGCPRCGLVRSHLMDPCPHEEKVDEYERFAHDNPRAIAAWVVYLESRIALEKENP